MPLFGGKINESFLLKNTSNLTMCLYDNNSKMHPGTRVSNLMHFQEEIAPLFSSKRNRSGKKSNF